jgi:LPXTG-motif cell wall-anchored protein
MTCVEGTCSVVEAADDTGGTVETLPDTGSGTPGETNTWLGALAAGSVVAAAASVLRRNREQPEERRLS